MELTRRFLRQEVKTLKVLGLDTSLKLISLLRLEAGWLSSPPSHSTHTLWRCDGPPLSVPTGQSPAVRRSERSLRKYISVCPWLWSGDAWGVPETLPGVMQGSKPFFIRILMRY